MIPEIDIWRVANLMLKLRRRGRTGERETGKRIRGGWRSRGRGGLATDYRRGRAAREYDASRTSALNGRSQRVFQGSSDRPSQPSHWLGQPPRNRG